MRRRDRRGIRRPLVEPHRRELHVHCYRMLGSFRSEDWSRRPSSAPGMAPRDFEGARRSGPGLPDRHRTPVSILRRRPRRAGDRTGPPARPAEVSWLEPFPDRLLERVAPRRRRAGEAVVARETIELAFLAAHPAPAAAAAGGADAARRPRLDGRGDARRCSRRASPRSTARSSAPGRRCGNACRSIAPSGRPPGIRTGGTLRAAALHGGLGAHRHGRAGRLAARGRGLRDAAAARDGPRTRRDHRTVEVGHGRTRRLESRFDDRQPPAGDGRLLAPRGRTAFRAVAVDVLRIEDGLIAEVLASARRPSPGWGSRPRSRPLFGR